MMDTLILAAMGWILLLMSVAAWQVVAARRGSLAIHAFDQLGLLSVGFLILGSFREGRGYYLDAALLLALLSFVGTLAAARFWRSGRVF